jgi:hypothetical protein
VSRFLSTFTVENTLYESFTISFDFAGFSGLSYADFRVLQFDEVSFHPGVSSQEL